MKQSVGIFPTLFYNDYVRILNLCEANIIFQLKSYCANRTKIQTSSLGNL